MKEASVRSIMAKLGLTSDARMSPRGWIEVPCPFAQWKHAGGVDRHPSFGIKVENAGRSFYKCQTCKSGGPIGALVRELGRLRGIDYGAIAGEAEAADLFGTSLPDYETLFATRATALVPLDEDAMAGLFDPPDEWPKAALDFLASRGVSLKTAEWIGLGFDPEKKRITFPVRGEDGSLYGFTGRTILKDHRPKVLDYLGLPKEHVILGVDRWRPGVPKLIVEGLFAYARCIENGALDYCDVGALLGAELTEGKAAILRNHLATQVIMMDPDKAGTDATWGPEATERDRWGKEHTVRQFERGIVAKLYRHTMLVVPQFPDLGDRPADIDYLNPDELRALVCGSPIFMPNKAFRDRMAKIEKGTTR